MKYMHPRPSSIVAALYTARDLEADLLVVRLRPFEDLDTSERGIRSDCIDHEGGIGNDDCRTGGAQRLLHPEDPVAVCGVRPDDDRALPSGPAGPASLHGDDVSDP